jgi:hypothetical protein
MTGWYAFVYDAYATWPALPINLALYASAFGLPFLLRRVLRAAGRRAGS